MTTIHVHGIKGGVGTTTVAVALARLHRGVYVSTDPSDAQSMLGQPVDPSVSVIGFGDPEDEPVIQTIVTEEPGPADLDVLVIDNSYASLRRAFDSKADAIVCVLDPERALDRQDVEDVLSRPVVVVPRSGAVARAQDAGIFGERFPGMGALTLVPTTEAAR